MTIVIYNTFQYIYVFERQGKKEEDNEVREEDQKGLEKEQT